MNAKEIQDREDFRSFSVVGDVSDRREWHIMATQ